MYKVKETFEYLVKGTNKTAPHDTLYVKIVK